MKVRRHITPSLFGASPSPLRSRAWAFLLSAAAILTLLLSTASSSFAGSATWKASPATGDWNTAGNWTAGGPPNGSADTATFASSNKTGVSLSANTEVNGVVFNAGASAFTITASPGFVLTISGVGITNNSGNTQSFVATADDAGNFGTIVFTNSAIAGSGTLFITQGRGVGTIFDGGTIHFTAGSSAGNGTFMNNGAVGNGGVIQFSDTSTAGDGTFTTNGAPVDNGSGGANTRFINTSTAGNGTFITNGSTFSNALGGLTKFFDTSTAGDGIFITNGAAIAASGAGYVQFFGSSTAGNGTFTTNGGEVSGGSGGFTDFFVTSSAGNGTFTNNGGLVSHASGGTTDFGRTFGISPTADNGTFINNGGLVSGAGGGSTKFFATSTAANATLISNGGLSGGAGGSIQFLSHSTGETARVEVFGNGKLVISRHKAPGVTTGSIEGSGNVKLGGNNLTVGGNNLTTTFSGVISDNGSGGSLTKVGTGTLTLSGANTYTGGTSINVGKLLVINTIGSGTGSGAVQVNSGTLGGRGTIAGAVTVGTGSGPGAILSPGSGRKPGTLKIQSPLVFNSDATYDLKLNSQKAVANKVVALGVTISSGALFSFTDFGGGALPPGTVFTVINNTAATPITGSFSNLADGATFTSNGTNFKASYTGGTGNDLILTVQ